jgi:methylthioribose-1-phosphate isomerase
MRVGGVWSRTIWTGPDGRSVEIIDQTELPRRFVTRPIRTVAEMAEAIRIMRVRGAPLIGVAAAHGVALAMAEDPSDRILSLAIDLLRATRPTAVNLPWALDRMQSVLAPIPPDDRAERSFHEAQVIADEDVLVSTRIAEHGEGLLRDRAALVGSGRPLNVLTHCNAGWLATVDWGTALAPIYRAHDAGLPIHVWVDETRPRNQGLLTQWELAQHGVPNTVIVDNAGGLLMRQGRVDLCLVGTDRTAANGDVANKIGTYLKALAAHDNGVPFYVAVPTSSIDWSLGSGQAIPIEDRGPAELELDPSIAAVNPGFDVTPAKYVTGLLTDRGVAPASREGLARLYPERFAGSGPSRGAE